MDIFNECNLIKYSAYRTAAKVRALQRFMCMENVKLNIVGGVFYRHHLRTPQNQNVIDRNALDAVIYDILFAAQKETSQDLNVTLMTEKLVDVLLRIYDRHEGGISVISAKVALTVLCCARLQEKYLYLFHQLADHNSCLSRRNMEVLLTELTKIIDFLSESHSFGVHLIVSTVNSGFQHCDGHLGITEESFMCWLLNEPQTLLWLSTAYRMQTAEKVCHYVKCDYCKAYPIRGFRYMCLLCFKYNQCQSCFFLGRVNKRHKLKHPVQEYCYETSSKEATCAFLKVLRNKLRRHPHKEIMYLPAELKIQKENMFGTEQCMASASSSSCSILQSRILQHDVCRKSILNVNHTTPLNPQAELQSIIHNLEEENRQLLSQLEKRNDVKLSDYLKDHKELIGAQVERLKKLKFHLRKINELLPPKTFHQQNGWKSQLCRLESTPVIPKSLKSNKHGIALATCLDSISPILKDVGGVDSSYLSWNSDQQEQAELASAKMQDTTESNSLLPSLSDLSVNDLSTQLYKNLHDAPSSNADVLSDLLKEAVSSKKDVSEDIDSIIDKLQKVLSSNFSFEDAILCDQDNSKLQVAATEMEQLLAGLINTIEHNKSTSK